MAQADSMQDHHSVIGEVLKRAHVPLGWGDRWWQTTGQHRDHSVQRKADNRMLWRCIIDMVTLQYWNATEELHADRVVWWHNR